MKHLKEYNLKITNYKNDKEHSILFRLKTIVNEYLTEGKKDLFKELKDINVKLDLKCKFKTDFSKKVLDVIINTKPGELTSYSEIAEKINSKAYRAVGAILKNNPLPLIIPCHRVINKNGKIGGFMGKMDKTWQIQLKRSLLKIEGNEILE